MAANNDTMAAIHEAVAQELLRLIKSGEAKSSDLSVAVKFLKDNGIEAIAAQDSPLANLAASLPTFDEDVDLPN